MSRSEETKLLNEGDRHWISTYYLNDERPAQKPAERPKGFGKRHLLAILTCFGWMLKHMNIICLNEAMVAMVNGTVTLEDNTTVHQCEDTSSFVNRTSVMTVGDFDWDRATQGTVLAGFYYGAIVTQIPGGYLAQKFGAVPITGIGILGASVMCSLAPVAAYMGPYWLTGARVVQGLFEGVTWPANHMLWGYWAPEREKAGLMAFVWSGSPIGDIIAMFGTGVLAEFGPWGGWPSAFYIFGGLGLIWSVFWFAIARSSPEHDNWISIEERTYIMENTPVLHSVQKLSEVPWLRIFTSPPVWAVVFAHFAFAWGLYTTIIEIPTYLDDVLHLDPSINGTLSALPYILEVAFLNTAGQINDYLVSKGYNPNRVRKATYASGAIFAALPFLLITSAGCSEFWIATLFCLALGFLGQMTLGFVVYHGDLSPTFAGVLMGMTASASMIPGFSVAELTGALTNGKSHDSSSWQVVFGITAGIILAGASLFVLLGSGDIQPWDPGYSEEDTNEMTSMDKEDQLTPKDNFEK